MQLFPHSFSAASQPGARKGAAVAVAVASNGEAESLSNLRGFGIVRGQGDRGEAVTARIGERTTDTEAIVGWRNGGCFR